MVVVVSVGLAPGCGECRPGCREYMPGCGEYRPGCGSCGECMPVKGAMLAGRLNDATSNEVSQQSVHGTILE